MFVALMGSMGTSLCVADRPQPSQNKARVLFRSLMAEGKKVLQDEQIGPWIKRTIPEVIIIGVVAVAFYWYRCGAKSE